MNKELIFRLDYTIIYSSAIIEIQLQSLPRGYDKYAIAQMEGEHIGIEIEYKIQGSLIIMHEVSGFPKRLRLDRWIRGRALNLIITE